MLALIGGSGLNSLADFAQSRAHCIDTPYGAHSGEILAGHWHGVPLLFLSRHGAPDQPAIAPHLVNYRANLWALHELGASEVLAVAAVGGIGAAYAPGTLSVPEQIIDYTWGRAHTFVEAGSAVQYASFCQPYADSLRQQLIQAAQRAGIALVNGGCYGATQGPRLESAAEIQRLARDGCDLVGMTGMPEAALARELDLPYASLVVVVNWAAGVAEREIALEEIYQNLEQGMQQAQRVLGALVQMR